MAGVLIGLILSFLVFFILTRRVWVRVIKEKGLRVQFHLPLLALHLINTDKKKSNQQTQSEAIEEKEKDPKLSTRAYIRISGGVLRRIKHCEVVVKRVILPCRTDNFGSMTLVSPFGYQGLVYAIIVYLKSKAKSLILEDNAIISSPDVTEAHFYLTVKLRLFQLIHALIALKRGINEEKRRAKGE